MNDDWKTDAVILHRIIDSHDAMIRKMAERIDALQHAVNYMGTAADNDFDNLYFAVRTIANETVPHLMHVDLTPKPKLRIITKDDDA